MPSWLLPNLNRRILSRNDRRDSWIAQMPSLAGPLEVALSDDRRFQAVGLNGSLVVGLTENGSDRPNLLPIDGRAQRDCSVRFLLVASELLYEAEQPHIRLRFTVAKRPGSLTDDRSIVIGKPNDSSR